MHVRDMTHDDASAVSALCLGAFSEAIVPSLSAQGVAHFADVVTPAAFGERLAGDNRMWVAVVDGVVRGMVELKQRRHVALLFVAPGWQRRGVGARLMEVALTHAEAGQITVSASLPSVAAYQRYGFIIAGDVSEHGGLVYQPMTWQKR